MCSYILYNRECTTDFGTFCVLQGMRLPQAAVTSICMTLFNKDTLQTQHVHMNSRFPCDLQPVGP